MSKMKRLICNTKFRLDAFGDGGSKRSVQIRSVLSDNDIAYEEESFLLPKGVPVCNLIKWSFRAIGFLRKYYPLKVKRFSEYIKLIKYYALRIPVVYDRYKNQEVVFLWENTTDKNLLYLMRATGNKVIGLPHNVESLVLNGTTGALASEVENLKLCDAVFVISKEETWLLRLLGIKADYFPYYPVKDSASFLLSVRKKREGRQTGPNKRFLLLGSATNRPTRIGMQTFLDYLGTVSSSFQLYVAGYGTESLCIPETTNIIFQGAISNDLLYRDLCEIDAVLVYQPPTTGALTRIIEMLVAGIPVFVNFDGARNYYNMEGVFIYYSFEHLYTMLCSFLSSSVILPAKESWSEDRFLALLKSFITNA